MKSAALARRCKSRGAWRSTPLAGLDWLKSTPAQYQAAILAAGRDLMSQGVGRLDRASDAFEREQQNLARVIGTVRGKRQQWE